MYDFEDELFKAEYTAYLKEKHRQAMEELREKKNAAQIIKDSMTIEEKINLMNTPYNKLPENLKPGMVKNPQTFNFVRISKPRIGRQKETFAARIIKHMNRYNLTPEKFSQICNTFARKYDLPATKDRRRQRTRITVHDINNYVNYNVCPKIDKMTVIAEAMGVGVDYFAGYGPDNRRSKYEILESRFRKKSIKNKLVPTPET